MTHLIAINGSCDHNGKELGAKVAVWNIGVGKERTGAIGILLI